jgi:hypothetical protein
MRIYRRIRSLYHRAFGFYIYITHSENPVETLQEWITEKQIELEKVKK